MAGKPAVRRFGATGFRERVRGEPHTTGERGGEGPRAPVDEGSAGGEELGGDCQEPPLVPRGLDEAPQRRRLAEPRPEARGGAGGVEEDGLEALPGQPAGAEAEHRRRRGGGRGVARGEEIREERGRGKRGARRGGAEAPLPGRAGEEV